MLKPQNPRISRVIASIRNRDLPFHMSSWRHCIAGHIHLVAIAEDPDFPTDTPSQNDAQGRQTIRACLKYVGLDPDDPDSMGLFLPVTHGHEIEYTREGCIQFLISFVDEHSTEAVW